MGALVAILPQASDWLPNATNGDGTSTVNTTNNRDSNNVNHGGVNFYGTVSMQQPPTPDQSPSRFNAYAMSTPRCDRWQSPTLADR